MARRKQPHPLQHQNSDLALSGFTPLSPNGANGKARRSPGTGGAENGSSPVKSSNGSVKGEKIGVVSGKGEQKGGLVELIICVGGIYVSLCVCHS